MPSVPPAPPFGGAFSRRFTRFSGLYFDEFAPDSAWIREEGSIHLPPLEGVNALVIRGDTCPHPEACGLEKGFPTLTLGLDGEPTGSVAPSQAGPWEYRFALSPKAAVAGKKLTLRLEGVAFTNLLAWLGRVIGAGFLQRYRGQKKNRQIRITSIETETGERIYDFSQRQAPYSAAFARRHTRLGMNIAGFLSADLGIGESARCMIRASDSAGIPVALIPLKLNCKNPLSDSTYANRFQQDNPHGVNVVHVDPPAARDIEHHHGRAFRQGKYSVGYFAWELPQYPDGWLSAFDHFDEVWCPSDFTTAAIALKSPVPVLTMPHSVAFERPTEDKASLRDRFGLPKDRFLFLSLFDLNSYSARKNPGAAIEAFKKSSLGAREAVLVVKVHNAGANPAEFAALTDAVRNRADIVLLTDTLSRLEVYALEAACDCFVSLHRSEGFGLVVAECMYLGKPVIATNWSATAEYLNADNGCPVRSKLVTLEETYGPYLKGSTWAQADVVHAAEWMTKIASDRALAGELGAAARKTVETRFSPVVIGARYRSRLEAIACF